MTTVTSRNAGEDKETHITPAGENIWTCASENRHLQATGIDSKKIFRNPVL